MVTICDPNVHLQLLVHIRYLVKAVILTISVGFFVCTNQPLKLGNLQLAKNGIMTHMFIFLLKRLFFFVLD